MGCRDISKTAVASYDTLQQMYVGLGIRRTRNDLHLNATSDLPATGLSLKGLTPDALKCFDDLTSGGGKSTVLQDNVGSLRQLIDYLRGDGNKGEADTITGEEIDAYVTEYMKSAAGKAEEMSAQEYRDLTVANLSAYVAVVAYVGGGTPSVPEVDSAADPLSAAIATYQTVQQMYAGLAGNRENTVRSASSENVPEGGIQIGSLTTPNLDKFYDAIGWREGQTPTTALQINANEIGSLIDYFSKPEPDGGDLDGRLDTISSTEIDAYVRAYVAQEKSKGNRTITFDGHRALTVGNINAFVGAVREISNPMSKDIPPTTLGSRVPASGTPDPMVSTSTSNGSNVEETGASAKDGIEDHPIALALIVGVSLLLDFVIGWTAFSKGRRGFALVQDKLAKSAAKIKSLEAEIETLSKPELRRNQPTLITRVKPADPVNPEFKEELSLLEKNSDPLRSASGGLLYDVSHVPADMQPVTDVVARQIALLYPSEFLTPAKTEIRNDQRTTLKSWAEWALTEYQNQNPGQPDPTTARELWQFEIDQGRPIVPQGLPLSTLKSIADRGFTLIKDQQGRAVYSELDIGRLGMESEASLAREKAGEASLFERGWVELAKK